MEGDIEHVKQPASLREDRLKLKAKFAEGARRENKLTSKDADATRWEKTTTNISENLVTVTKRTAQFLALDADQRPPIAVDFTDENLDQVNTVVGGVCGSLQEQVNVIQKLKASVKKLAPEKRELHARVLRDHNVIKGLKMSEEGFRKGFVEKSKAVAVYIKKVKAVEDYKGKIEGYEDVMHELRKFQELSAVIQNSC